MEKGANPTAGDHDVGVAPGEEYGVAALHLPFHPYSKQLYDPREDDSDSEGEHATRAIAWMELAPSPESEQGGCISDAVHMAQAEASQAVRLRLMLDSGASIHLFQTDAMLQAATQLTTDAPLGHINGVGGRTDVTAMLGARLHLDGGVSIVLKAPFARAMQGAGAAAQDILSTGKLFDDMGIITMLDPNCLLYTSPSPRD